MHWWIYIQNFLAQAPTPHGTQFFRFHIHFHQKVPASEVDAPCGKSWIRPCNNRQFTELLNGIIWEMIQIYNYYLKSKGITLRKLKILHYKRKYQKQSNFQPICSPDTEFKDFTKKMLPSPFFYFPIWIWEEIVTG